jgi:spore germination protein
MKKIIIIFLLVATLGIIIPHYIFAATKLKFGGWLPFWKKQVGANDTSLHLDQLQEISPFSYEVNPSGTLRDTMKITQGFWPGWLSAIRDLKIKIIPTVAWFDRAGIYKLLSSKKKRTAHVSNIVSMVKKQNFSGVDIDYEDKSAETGPYFSSFIKSLSAQLHAKNKILACTVEGRTPLTSLFDKIPPDHQYANDYSVLNRYCDEVRIMAYDQGTIDLTLNRERGNGQWYVPVADKTWVEKILNETLKTISPKKIMLGVPTYGYEYQVVRDGDHITYSRIRSYTYSQAVSLASTLGVIPTRNIAGELSFSYATTTVTTSSPALTFVASSTVLNPSISANSSITRLVWFSDANAIADKISLAQKYKLRGVFFFKLDSEQDPAMWDKMSVAGGAQYSKL